MTERSNRVLLPRYAALAALTSSHRCANQCKQTLHVARDIGLPLAASPGLRMNQRETNGVQCLTMKRRQRCERMSTTIRWIAHERMADSGQMHANLMRASGDESATEE